MRRIAVYPGTFDPITNGHTDLCQRAVKLFDEVILAVAMNGDKQTHFSVNLRMQLARDALADTPGIVVASFEGLLVDFARQHGAQVILRGLRAVSDFEYELQLATMNHNLNEDIETLFLTPSEKYAFLSSSLVKEVAQLGGDVSSFLHPCVINALMERKV